MTFRRIAAVALVGVFATASTAALAQERTPAPETAQAYIISPADGQTVTSPVTVVFGLKDMGVAPAGTEKAKTGHHHLIIDAPLPSMNEPVPADEHYRHFGGGQTETTIELSQGAHTLQLLLGDMNHIPHFPPVMSSRITINVR